MPNLSSFYDNRNNKIIIIIKVNINNFYNFIINTFIYFINNIVIINTYFNLKNSQK